jgi:chemotaxis protein methyltransferase CheR
MGGILNAGSATVVKEARRSDAPPLALASLTQGKEFAFTPADFERIRQLIHARAGIALGGGKQEMVYSRLSRRLRALSLTSFADYLTHLQTHGDGAEWELFTNALTTNLTSFFREDHHFPMLAEHARGRGGPLKVWCNASSTGEEPYSIAITLCEAFDSLRPPVSILATDIDTKVLQDASDGVYPIERVAELSEARRKRFFLRGKGELSGKVRIRPELRSLIEFRPLNLLANDWAVKGPLDVIFCRNVMIYFDKPTQRRILERFVPLMKPDALLFSGHSENVSFVTDLFKLKKKTVYQLQPAPAHRARELPC